MKLLASGFFAMIAVLDAAADCGFEQAEVHIGYRNRNEEVRTVACTRQVDGAWRFHMPVSQIPRDAWYVDVFTQGASPAKGEGYWVTGDCNHGKLTRDKGFVETAIMRLPIFGVAAPGGSFVAIVKTLRGEFTHQVRAGGGRYRISPRFKIERMEFAPYEDIVVDYYPLAGADANYSGMARKYREWQLARGEVKPLKEKIKGSEALKWSTESIFLRCKFGRSIRKGIDHKSFITNTPPMSVDHTFDDFMDIMRKCKALGMDNVDMCMVGWQPGGHDGPFPDLFPPDDRFGGEVKMREAIAFGKSLGYRMSVHVNWHNYYSSSKRWCVEDVAKGLDGQPRVYAKLPILPAGRCYDACYAVMCNKYVDDDIARLIDLGLDGMLHMDVMSAEEPTPCHDPRHPATRGDMIRWQKAIGEKARLSFGGSSSESGFDQFASALDNILYVAWEPREHPMCDGMLPIFPIAYNGIVMSQPFYATIDAPCYRSKDEMMSEAFKAFLWIPSAEDRVLKVFEWGGRPMFYYTMYTDRDLADIKRMYDEWQPLKHLQLEFIHEHVTLAPSVTATRYENGEEVICNASDARFAYRGATVGPHGHRLFGPAAEGARPCRDVRFKPIERGTMLYGDTTRLGPERPFAKDPTVIRHGGRYLMYYSACSYDEAHVPSGLSKGRRGWCGAIAESTNLVDWVRIGDIEVDGAPFAGGWVAPCVKKFDGKIHLFAQGIPPPKRKGEKVNNVLWHATSDDGVHFTCADGKPAFAPKNGWSINRAIDAEVYRVGDRMMLMYATRESPDAKIQQLGMAWAPWGCDYGADNWTEISIDAPFFKPERKWEMKCIEAPTVVRRKGVWYMFYAGAYNHERQQIGLAWSTDGVKFTRFRDTPILPHGPEGSWNAWESGHPGVFEDDDGHVYLFYQGKKTRNGDYRLSCLEVEFVD